MCLYIYMQIDLDYPISMTMTSLIVIRLRMYYTFTSCLRAVKQSVTVLIALRINKIQKKNSKSHYSIRKKKGNRFLPYRFQLSQERVLSTQVYFQQLYLCIQERQMADQFCHNVVPSSTEPKVMWLAVPLSHHL